MQKPIAWFEIPVADLERARHFYEQTFGIAMQVVEFEGTTMAMFPYDQPATGGCLTAGAQYAPGGKGVVIYLDGGADLAVPLAQAKRLGGIEVMPKTAIGEHGHIALFKDSEGNTVGLHSMS